MITLPTTIASDLTASLGDQLSDTGTLAVVIFVAAIPLAFYVIRKILDLIPKDKEKKTYTPPAQPPTHEEMERLHKQYEFWEKPITLPKDK